MSIYTVIPFSRKNQIREKTSSLYSDCHKEQQGLKTAFEVQMKYMAAKEGVRDIKIWILAGVIAEFIFIASIVATIFFIVSRGSVS